MDIADFLGSQLQPTKRWTGGTVEVSGPNVGQVPAEELKVDPFLPVVATDPYDPAVGIAIPAGRFVAIGSVEPVVGTAYDAAGAVASSNVSAYRMGHTNRGKTWLTLAEGNALPPVGMSVNNIFRSTAQYSSGNFTQSGPYQGTGDTFATDSGASASDVKFRKNFFASVPFVLQINNVQGALQSGDEVVGYHGSTTSTTSIGWVHRGKPVKRNAQKLRFQNFAINTTATLTEAIYPNQVPTVTALFNAGTPVTGTTTFAWNGTNWVATFPANVNSVFYNYGQDSNQVGGKVVRVQSLQDLKSREELFKFVEIARDDYLNYPPPFSQRVAVTQRTAEVANAITAGYIYRVQNGPVSINHSIVIEMQGDVTDPTTGITTNYASSNWYTLPSAAATVINGGLTGPYHTMNWKTGVIELAGNLTATSVRVTYASIANRKDGAVLWGAGIEGLTDGRYNTSAIGSATAMVPTNRAGVPSQLNFADVVGEMRLLVD